MDKLICYENLRRFAYSNDHLLQGPVRGIAVEFFGLGVEDMFDGDIERDRLFAEKGVILLIPYNNPWAWMNRQAVAFTDECLDALFNHYRLPEGLPIVSTGGSMGGQSALVYTRYARRTPCACVTNCPVCDLPYHFTERPDLPRTLYSAFWNEPGSMEEALKSASPLHLAAELPDIPYTVFHCEEDRAVNKAMHSDRLAAAMAGRRLTYISVPGCGHCELPGEYREQYDRVILEAAGAEAV